MPQNHRSRQTRVSRVSLNSCTRDACFESGVFTGRKLSLLWAATSVRRSSCLVASVCRSRTSPNIRAKSWKSPACTAIAAAGRPSTACACWKSRSFAITTACSKSSSAVTWIPPSEARATPAVRSCSCWRRAWTTSCAAWAWAEPSGPRGRSSRTAMWCSTATKPTSPAPTSAPATPLRSKTASTSCCVKTWNPAPGTTSQAGWNGTPPSSPPKCCPFPRRTMFRLK